MLLAGTDNETLTSYSYDFAGESYRSTGVGVSEFKDNIGSYHQDMQAYLHQVQINDEFLPIWVNPDNPSEAVIDRHMRWGLFALTGVFCSIFLLVGLGVIYASLRSSSTVSAHRGPSLWKMRKTWQQAKQDGTTDLDRSYNIPVFATGETARNVSHDISAQAAAVRKQDSDAARLAIASGRFDIEGLSRAMRLRNEGNRIQLRFPMFRNKMLTLFAAVFAGGFGFASYSMADMASGGGLFGIFITIFGIPFFLMALVAAIATVYLLLNNLKVDIEPGEVSVLRSLMFIPIYRRQLRRGDISHLSIKRSGSTGQGVDKIEHFKIRAEDDQGRKVTLAEDIDGEDVAAHFRDYLAQRIGVTVR
ncbi:MAG: DUF3592 domain-containing protein [Gammaproteobacteria bacterium]|nr:DUF3592 domain-containing protein [Gammaproteobacteria bacterium]